MTLTYDLNSESSVLGVMLLEQKKALECLLELKEDDFFDKGNRAIFKAMKSLSDIGEPLEVSTICRQLKKENTYEMIGGVERLVELTNSVENFSSLNTYITSIKEFKLLRNLIETVDNIKNDYTTKNITDINDFVLSAEKSLTNVTREREIKGFSTSKEIITKIGLEFDLSLKGETVMSEIKTGYDNLDKLTGGFKKGNLIIVAARPSVGKTAFAMELCLNNANLYHKPVAVFSLEMTKEDILKRCLARISGVNYENISRVTFTSDEYKKIRQGEKVLSELPLFIDDDGGNSIDTIVAKCRKLKQDQGDIGLVMIDYIGLIVPGNKKANNRQEEVSEISRRLKELSKEIECPVICLSQLSRQCELRDDKRPMLSDLRESGSIEQDADQVYLMYRGDYYKRSPIADDSKQEICIKQDVEERNYNSLSVVEINVAKNRNGQIGICNMLFLKNICHFFSPNQEAEEVINKVRNFEGSRK